MHGIQPQRLSDDELLRYTQMLLDKKEPVPEAWLQEVVNRFHKVLDRLYARFQ